MLDRPSVIAERRFRISACELVEEGELVLSIFAPYAEGGYWRCDFSISGLGTKGIVQGRGQGLDSFDAVLSAMQIASIRIYTSELHKAGRLEWLEKGAGYGLPLLDSLADIAHPGLKPVSTLHVYI